MKRRLLAAIVWTGLAAACLDPAESNCAALAEEHQRLQQTMDWAHAMYNEYPDLPIDQMYELQAELDRLWNAEIEFGCRQ